MNYFRVHSVGLLGLQGIPVEVECMQSRRLPYLQILGSSAGAAAEMRERVMAALESAGCRLPARRITVRFQPGIHGFSLENLDLAMALAILAASGKIPRNRLEDLLICGSLGLNGRIQAVGSEHAARSIYARKKFRGSIVPFEESAWLSDASLAHGGGFESLADVISFLIGAKSGIRRQLPASESINLQKSWHGNESSARLLEIAAAGGHHALLLAPTSSVVSDLAAALADILACSSPASISDKEFLHRLRGNGSIPPSSYMQFPLQRSEESSNRSFTQEEELLFATNGVIFVDKLASLNAKTTSSLFSWMDSGKTTWRKLGHVFSESLEANVIACSSPCECGGRVYGRCSCRPLDLQKYRRRLERAVSGPFDIRYCVPEEKGKKQFNLSLMANTILNVRSRIQLRQSCVNGKLSAQEVMKVKKWSEKALLLFRSISSEAGLAAASIAPLPKIALTISDLKDGPEVSEQDLLEARHYSCFGEA